MEKTPPALSSDTTSRVDTFDGYDSWARDYDAFDNPLIAMTDLALARSGESVAGARVVEFGCGTGRNAQRFLDDGAAAYIGIDGSEGMLARARHRFRDDARVRFVSADFRSATMGDVRDADLVFFSLVLEHTDDLDSAFRAAARAAKSGARLRALELHAERHGAGTRAHFRVGDGEVHLPSFAHSNEDLRRALDRTGWEMERATDWYATSVAIERCRKLEKHVGTPVVVDIAARRR